MFSQRLAASAVFYNDDLMEIVFQYIHPTELLSEALTSKFFLNICLKFGLTKNLRTSVKWFCHSRNGIAWVVALGCPIYSISQQAILISTDEESVLKLFEWLREDKICYFQIGTCEAASQKGYLRVLKWLRSLDPPCPWSGMACRLAAEEGELEVLKWLWHQDPPRTRDLAVREIAAERGHLDILTWLHAQGLLASEAWKTSCAAARGGQVEVLKWLQSNDLPSISDKWTCTSAAAAGQLDLLKWLRSQCPPCPWDLEECIEMASYNRRADVLRWLELMVDLRQFS